MSKDKVKLTRIKSKCSGVTINNSFNTNYLDGLLLGDGCLWIRSSCRCVTPRYTQGCIKKVWVDTISKFFSNAGIINSVHATFNNRVSRGNEKILWNINTRVYQEFFSFYNRWYPDGIKVVPKDINLNSQLLANWYMGDGCFTHKKYGTIVLSTQGFIREDVIYLSDLVNEYLDINSRVSKRNEIYIHDTNSVEKFLNSVILYVLPCFEYKLIGGRWGYAI